LTRNDNAVIGVDLGGTKVSAGIFDSTGQIVHKETLSIKNKQGLQVGDAILSLIAKFQKKIDVNGLTLSGVGMAVPGIYHSHEGSVWAPNIPGWDNFPLLDLITSNTPNSVQVVIDSDRACYILGETWKGVAQGCKNAIFLAVGTGIGAGILIDGQILRGANDVAGAIGWLAVTHPHLPDYKTFGCFEYHASGDGIARMAAAILREKQTFLKGSEQLNPDQITCEEVFEAYDLGDLNAKSVIELAIEFWAKASANLVSLFNPEMIIFGGGVFGPAIQFIDQIYAEAKKWAQPVSIGLVKFVPSQLETDAGLLGAGFLALKEKQ